MENRIVEAGAGTGKTESIVARLLEALLVDDLPLESILALTFTEKAAHEMSARVTDAVARIAAGETAVWEKWRGRIGGTLDLETARERARRALGVTDRSMISTIHAFCSHLLRLYPVEAVVPPSFEVDEGTRFGEEFDRAWRGFLDEELREDGTRASSWRQVLAAVDLEQVGRVARELCGDAAIPLPMNIEVPLEDEIVRLRSRIEPLRSALPGRFDKRIDYWRSLTVADLVLSGKAGMERARIIFDKFDSLRKNAPEICDEVEHLLRTARILPGCRIIREMLDLLTPFALRFRRDFRNLGYLTFPDLLVSARALLREHREVRRRVKEEYRAILVDETQDTDPIQYDIILYLAERRDLFTESFRDPAYAVEEGKIHVVGDKKQSIYAFRGADLAAFKSVGDLLERKGARREYLGVNYRSCPGVVDIVNGLFAKILGEDYRPVEAHRNERPGRELEIIRCPEEMNTDEARDAESEAIADWIVKNLRKGERGKAAILLRAFPRLYLYLGALRRRGIPFVVEGERYFYRAQEVIDFLSLLSCVVNPYDRIALVGFLRSIYAGLTDEEIFRLRKDLDYRRSDAHPIYARLRRLHDLAGVVGLENLFDEALAEFRVLETVAGTPNGSQAAANLAKLRRKAWGASARAFLDESRKNILQETDEGESPIADEGLDAVRIMTIHKAKGLEFDICFIPDVHREMKKTMNRAVPVQWSTGRAGFSLGRLEDRSGRNIREVYEDRVTEELKRILYVAMTRAKEKIVLTGKFDGVKGMTFARHLTEAEPRILGETGTFRVGRGEIVVTDWTPSREQDIVTIDGGVAEALKGEAEKALRRWEERRAACRRILETPILRTPSGAAEHEKRNADRDVEQVWLDGADESREIGMECHRVLEKWDFRGPKDALPAGCRRPEARKILDGFVGSEAYRRIAGATILGREVPFSLKDGESVISGVIDLVCEVDGRLHVVDYKTDRRIDIERYRAQMAWYVRAVGDATPVIVALREGKWLPL